MSDDRKGPVWRPRSHQDRDVYTDKRTPPRGLESIPEPVWEDATGRYEGDDLQAVRRKRPTDKRVEHLEKRQDEADKRQRESDARHAELAIVVGRMEGKVEGVGDKVDTVVALLTDRGKTERTKISTNGKVMIAIGTAAFAAIAAILKVVLS